MTVSNQAIRRVFLFLCFFPWVSFGVFGGDTQPFFIFFLLAYGAMRGISRQPVIIDRSFVLLSSLILIGLFFAVAIEFFSLNRNTSMIFRGVVGYSSVFLMFVLFRVAVKSDDLDLSMLLAVNCIYLFVGMLQQLGVSFDALLSTRGDYSRGVASLTAEPSFFGMVLVILNVAYLVIGLTKASRVLVWLNTMAVFLLAQSMTAVIALSLFMIFHFVTEGRDRKVYTFLGAPIIITLSYLVMTDGTRFVKLITIVFDSGITEVLSIDASANGRLGSVYFPLVGFFKNTFFPGGFSTYSEMAIKLTEASDFIWYNGGGKISSYVGNFIYELGIFGAIFILMMFAIPTLFKGDFLLFFVLFGISLMAMPAWSPFWAMLIAILHNVHRCGSKFSRTGRF